MSINRLPGLLGAALLLLCCCFTPARAQQSTPVYVQFHTNIGDGNAPNLDTQNGGFTVFGRIVGTSSLTIMDRINALTTFNFGSPFDELPLVNYTSGGVQDSNFVKVFSLTRLTQNTPAGSGVTTQAGGTSVTFSSVSQTGSTTITPIDPVAAGTPPAGYTLCPTCAAYDITTNAVFTPPVTVCLAVPPSLDQQAFLSLALLHGENGALVDRTTGRVTNTDGTRQVRGGVQSLSPFALAQASATPTPTPTPTATPTPTPCPAVSLNYTVSDVKVTIGGDSFEFIGAQNESVTLTSGVATDVIFENGLLLKPSQATTPSGEYSANVSFNVTFDGSVSTTLSRVVKYTVTPTQRLVSFETGDAKTIDLGAKGKLDVTVAPRAVASTANGNTALHVVPAHTDEATFRLHDIPVSCETPNTVQFSATTYDASEGAAALAAGAIGSGEARRDEAAQAASTGVAVVEVTRAGDLSQPAEVEYATQPGTALDRTDFTAAYGTLRFAAGESSKSLSILITDDVYQEGQESLFVTLSNPVGVALGTPSTAAVQITSDDAATGSSPVKDSSFDSDRYVRYHYADFLNRLPDADGLAFWKSQIDECEQRPAAERQSCREVKRVHVSAAFFLSIEFQETGYLVYRLHQAAFDTGEHLQLSRFLHDTQEIRQGVVVGQGPWEQQLEANKQLFAERFVARADFLARYPATMSGQQFVDALNVNTNGSLSQAERDAVVQQLAAGNTTQARALALSSIADDADFRARETNRAFVLMQYFGYLRRNPPDAPDLTLDFQGYNFWLQKLNQFGGNFVNAEMVKAFILSIEYGQRFGQL